jgi:competence protein ComEC
VQAGHGLPAWRERTSAAIALQVAHPAARFVQALALGDTRGLSDTDWDHLRALGLTHLVAISGFHVGVVAGWGVAVPRAVVAVPAAGPALATSTGGGMCRRCPQRAMRCWPVVHCRRCARR